MIRKIIATGASAVTGVVLAFAMVATAAAWHPEGQIKKYVQNVSENSTVQDADSANEAVQAKTGDTLKYVIEIKNVAAPAQNEWNDMHYIVLKDTLPEGVELISDPSKRQIVENLSMLEPGEKHTKEYLVRVTSDINDDVITNKACFTGDSKVKDNKQSGCDDAVAEVFVPKTSSTVTDKPSKGQDQPEVQAAVTELPKTGAQSAFVIFSSASGLGYAAHAALTRKSRRQ